MANSLSLGSLWPDGDKMLLSEETEGVADLAHPYWGHFPFGHLLGSFLIFPVSVTGLRGRA